VKENRYVLAIDCGTQSLRILVFDALGNLTYKDKYDVDKYKSLKPGWKEIDPDHIWEMICHGIRCLSKKEPNLFHQVEGITLSCQRDSIVVVDDKGFPLRDCISWMDARMASNVRPMALWANLVLRMVRFKRIADVFNREFRGNWIRENEPEIWEKTRKYLFLSTYLNYRLTGEYKDSTAATVGHVPFDYKRFRWTGKRDIKRQIFQIEDRYLHELVKPGTILGAVTREASEETGLSKGLKVLASGSDKGCETLGVGCNDLNKGSISLGSQATIQTTSKKYFELVTLFPPFPSVKYGWYNPEITIYRGYWMVKWFEKEFAHEELASVQGDSKQAIQLLDEKLDTIPPGCEGLVLQPFWGQELLRPEARGTVLGFSDYHGKTHLYRAIIEGIGFALKEGIERLEKKSGVRMEEIALSGGGSQSDTICQITADIINRKVFKVQTYETTGLGASITAFVGLGVYKDVDEAVEKMVRVSKVFQPNDKNVQIYEHQYRQIYKRMYRRLKPLYKSLLKSEDQRY